MTTGTGLVPKWATTGVRPRHEATARVLDRAAQEALRALTAAEPGTIARWIALTRIADVRKAIATVSTDPLASSWASAARRTRHELDRLAYELAVPPWRAPRPRPVMPSLRSVATRPPITK
jgi:hypothetical protein